MSGDSSSQIRMDMSCLYYGSKVVIKLDSIDILRAQFEKLEKRFRNEEQSMYDLKLPLSIIEMFSKLWNLWSDFPELQQSIDESTFRQIFSSMFLFFQGKGQAEKTKKHESSPMNSDCSGTVNGNLLLDSYSDTCATSTSVGQFAYHDRIVSETITVKKPQKLVNKKTIQNISASCRNLAPSTFTELKLARARARDRAHSVNSSREKRSVSRESCKMTRQNSYPAISAAKIVDESSPYLRVLSRDDPHCGVCCREFPAGDESLITEHLASVRHKKNLDKMKDCLFLLQTENVFITILNPRTFEFTCKLCDKTHTGTNCLVQHCISKEHREKTKQKD